MIERPLIAVVGDISPDRPLDPPLQQPAQAKKAAEELGAALAKQGARLLVYGGPFLEADVVRGFVNGKPKQDHSIIMQYSKDNEPPPFAEESLHPKLFERHAERGADWEVAFYRANTKADGIILLGGGNATKISGLVAIGSRMPILAFPEFGGGAAKVWETLSAGEDLPNRDEIDLMARPWKNDSAQSCIKALLNQADRRQLQAGATKPVFPIVAGILFLAALAVVPLTWGKNEISVWTLFMVPVIAGGAGSLIRKIIDQQQSLASGLTSILVPVILGLVAGGVAGVLFVTAQLTADPDLTNKAVEYANRSIPFALGIGFIAGLTSEAVFGKLLRLDVVRVGGVNTGSTKR